MWLGMIARSQEDIEPSESEWLLSIEVQLIVI
jgi:hypothetical protein